LLSKDLETNNETSGKHAPTTVELLLEMVLCNPLLGSCNSSTTTMETGFFLCGPCQGVIWKTIGATQLVVSCQLIGSSAREAEKRWLCSSIDSELTELVESQPVKRRLGDWCEMATSPVVELREFCTGGCEDRT
jgi:hypothetical protein